MPLADKQVTLEHEKLLWDAKELDLDTSKGLLHAVIFYLIKCFAIWQCKELRQLQTSHVAFGENKLGKFVALDLQSSFFKRKRCVKRYDDPANPRSVYKILKKYRSRIANEGPFLVRPISSIKDFVCFGPLPLGIRLIKTFISNLMEDAGIGRCFVNYSLNLQAVDTLQRFGTGFHCLTPWMIKNNNKSLSPTPTPECSSSNCEDLNPEVSVMISRLLDAPYPFNAVDIIQKMEHQEQRQHSEIAPNFDSWMTNIMEGEDKELEQKPEIPVLKKSDLIETEKELNMNQVSGCKVHIVSASKEEKLLSCGSKACKSNSKSCSTSKSNEKEESCRLKIATVSSITEGAFCSQVDEGDHIGEKTNVGNIDESEPSAEFDHGKLRLGKSKKRKNISKTETESEETTSKVSKLHDCNETSSCEPPKKLHESDAENEVYSGSNSAELNETTTRMLSKTEPDHEIVMKNRSHLELRMIENDITEKNEQNIQPKQVDASLKKSVSKPEKSSERQIIESQNKGSLSSPVPVADSSSQKCNLHHPNSSLDSITILRRLLLSRRRSEDEFSVSDEMSSKISCRNSMVNGISWNKNETDMCKVDDKQKNPISECGSSVQADREIIEEDECMLMDLSPPTLSPQPLTCLPGETVDPKSASAASPDDITSSSSNQCAPNLVPVSSDIVQFLDKAQQQIKNILNSTASENDCQNVNGDSPLKSKIMKQKHNEAPSKHSRKSRKPVKIINVPSPGEASPKRDMISKESWSISSPTSLKLSEQSQPHFPLLRQFLERPIGETEIVMASKHSQSAPSNTDSKNKTLLPSPCNSSAHSISEPPKLTFMGNATTCHKIDGIEDDQVHKELEHSRQGYVKKIRNHSDLSTPSEERREHPHIISSPSLSSSMPSSPASPPAGWDSPDVNCAVYRAEKDVANNAVYQSLNVNYEKDGMRTFTFADIPNVSHSASHSRRFQSSRQTSEINLGDYFPPGTLIPAKDIHLVTQQSPGGCDIVMKFNFCSKD